MYIVDVYWINTDYPGFIPKAEVEYYKFFISFEYEKNVLFSCKKKKKRS